MNGDAGQHMILKRSSFKLLWVALALIHAAIGPAHAQGSADDTAAVHKILQQARDTAATIPEEIQHALLRVLDTIVPVGQQPIARRGIHKGRPTDITPRRIHRQPFAESTYPAADVAP